MLLQQMDESLTKEQCWYQIGEECIELRRSGVTRHEAARRVGLKYDCSADAVGHRERYAKAIDRIREINPNGAEALLFGKISLQYSKVILPSKKQPKAIQSALERLANPNVTFADVFPEYSGKAKKSVKDVPAYDPDAQVTGLLYTMPSWMDCLERVGLGTDFGVISVDSFHWLQKALDELKTLAENIIKIMTEAAK